MNFTLQLRGRKRWRLWPSPAVLGAASPALLLGKAAGRRLDPARLGPAALTVSLRPGDVLYVPRGCIHATDTAELPAGELSAHLTVGLEAALLPAEALAEAAAGGALARALASGLRGSAPGPATKRRRLEPGPVLSLPSETVRPLAVMLRAANE